MITRLLFFCVLTFLLLLAPWWMLALALLVGIAIFPTYYEAVFFALASDILYGSTSSGVFHRGVSFSLCILALLLVMELFVKRFTRFYER